MKKQYIFFAVLMVVLVLIGTEVAIHSREQASPAEQQPKPTQQQQPPVSHETNQKPKDQNSVQKGVRRFELSSTDKMVVGDGAFTLKDTLTSVGLRLVTAPKPPTGMVYEAYLVTGTQAPVFLGELREGTSKLFKYFWAGAGEVGWYKADKVIVTKRKPADPRPGQTVAEGKIRAEEALVQQK